MIFQELNLNVINVMKLYFNETNENKYSELKYSDDTQSIMVNEKEINNLYVSDLNQSFLETSPASKGCKKFSFDETLKSIQRHDICYFRKS